MNEDPRQFGSFDGLDNRRTILELFVRLGGNLPSFIADHKRALFLRDLHKYSRSFKTIPFQIDPCDPIAAYNMFVAITGVLGVPIEKAAQWLEREVQRQ
jgi:hypothetical protein